MRDFIAGPQYIKGKVRAYEVFNGLSPIDSLSKQPGQQWNARTDLRDNTVLYDWGAIVAILLSTGNAAYRIGYMYLEYENLTDSSNTVSPPAYDRSGGIDYYSGLSISPNVDYLRIPVIAAVGSNSNPTQFRGNNVMTFFTQSQGVAGVNGKSFGASYNSKVYGAALVAAPAVNDPTQDLIFSRYYFLPGEQQIKNDNSQIGIEWQVALQ